MAGISALRTPRTALVLELATTRRNSLLTADTARTALSPELVLGGRGSFKLTSFRRQWRWPRF
jgi:hypothetical protein